MLLAFALAAPALGEPWVAPGDMALRHDLQILADAGVISAPLTTWPLSWANIAHDLNAVHDPQALGTGARAAYRRLQARLKVETLSGTRVPHLRLAFTNEPRTLRTFDYTAREDTEAQAGVSWTGLRFSYRLQAIAVSDPDDNRRARIDGSYLGVAIGNWMLAVGAMDRWWGPGWEGSLILSSNARPIPALSINRNISDPFDTKWLSWIGPWSADVVWGQLESDRAVPDARFFAARVALRPLRSLELGLSRSALWCGKGRPCDFDVFVDLLTGNDNRGAELAADREPGNQLGGVDFRYSRGHWRYPLAFYGQFIGEDEAGGLPSRWIGQLGAEHWGYSERLQGSYRLYFEAADTTVQFYESQPLFGVAYNHGIYRSGYRYRGRSIGHPMDGDGRLYSAGGMLTTDGGASWKAMLRFGELNRGPEDARHSITPRTLDFANVEVGHTRRFGPLSLAVTLGYEYLRDEAAGSSDGKIRAFAELYWSP